MNYYLIDKHILKCYKDDTQYIKRISKITGKNVKLISGCTYYLIGILYYVVSIIMYLIAIIVSIPAKIFNNIFNVCIKQGDKFNSYVLHHFEE